MVNFTFTLYRENQEGEEIEIKIEVTGYYSPGRPARPHLPNGDPGYDADPPECEILEIYPEIDLLPEEEDQIKDKIIKLEKQNYS